MAIELLVIADDITGSLDTGVQFAGGGRRAIVTVGPEPLGRYVDVWIVDTESRHVTAGEAARRVGDAVTAARALGAQIFYKKTDSTLRGNIGAELDAALVASEREALVFAPAFPALGRTTCGGRQLVDGVPVDETSFGRDPLNPVHTAQIAQLIAEQSSIRTALAADAASVRSAASGGARIIVVDASLDETLLELAGGLWAERKRWVFAGSAGFANALCRVMAPRAAAGGDDALGAGRPAEAGAVDAPAGTEALAGTEAPTGTEALASKAGPSRRVLIVCGSLNPVSLAQVGAAEQLGIPSVVAPLDQAGGVVPLGQPGVGAAAASRVVDEACGALARSEAVIVRSFAPGGRRREGEEIEISKLLAGFVRAMVARTGLDVLAVFGGDTLIEIMRALGIAGLAPYAEVTPGVAVSAPMMSEAGPDGPVPRSSGRSPIAGRAPVLVGAPAVIVSKAGGFGAPDLVSSILTHVRKQT